MDYSAFSQHAVPLLQWSGDQCMTAVMPPRPTVNTAGHDQSPATIADVLLSTPTAFHRQPNQPKSEQCTVVSPQSLQTFSTPRAKQLQTFVMACWLYVVPVTERDRQPAVLLQQHHVGSKQLALSLTLLPGSHTLQFQYHPPACYGLPTVTLLSARPIQVKQWMHLTLGVMEGTVRLYVNQQIDSQCVVNDQHAHPMLHRSSLHLGWSFSGFLHNVVLGSTLSQIQSATTPVPQYPTSDALSCPPLRCSPLDSITELLAWTPHNDSLNTSSVSLRHRPPVKQKNRVIHCHNLKGGYTDDAYAPGASPVDLHTTALTAHSKAQTTNNDSHAPSMLSYNFTHWQLIDIIIYFSHHCITIPPQQWVHTAHRNGVLCLGTMLTEGSAGIHQNRLLLASAATSQRCADQLVAIAVYYGFDGWVVRIAADLPTDPLPADDAYTQRLIRFTAYLRQQMHKANPHSMVIMCDTLSMHSNGEVELQSELNQRNVELFKVADAFITDHKWQPEAVARSADAAIQAGRSPVEVFMGIDVWSRGSWKSGLDTWQAVQHCFQAGVSVMLYAPSFPTESLCTGNRATRAMARRYERKFWLVDDFDELQLTADQWQPAAAVNGTAQAWRHEADASSSCMVSAAPTAKAGELYAQELTVDLTKLSSPQAPPVPAVTCIMQYKASSPGAGVQVRIVITLSNADDFAVDVYDSGLLSCTDEWQSFDCMFDLLWCEATTLAWRVEGSNADDQTVLSGLQVTVPLLLVSRQPQLTMAGVVQRRRLSFTKSLPLHHSVHTGIGVKHGIVYNNYDLQSTRAMVSYRKMPAEHFNELASDDWKHGNLVVFLKELDDISSTYSAPALQFGATIYHGKKGPGFWTGPVRLLEFAATAQPLGDVDQLYVYVTLRHRGVLKPHSWGVITPFIRLVLQHDSGPQQAVNAVIEELQLLELPAADNDQVYRMFCKIPGLLVSGRVVSAVDLLVAYDFNQPPPKYDHMSIQSVVITEQPLSLSPISTDCTAFTRCADLQPVLQSLHWRFDSVMTGVERYSAVLTWSSVAVDPHSYPLYQVYCNNIRICATRHTSCWVDSYVGTKTLGQRQPLYRVEVL